MESSFPLYRTAAVPTATPALAGASGQRRLMAILLFGGSTDSQVECKDAATDTGTVLIGVNALAKTSKFIDFSEIGGVVFNTGLFVKPAGTGAIAYVWYE